MTLINCPECGNPTSDKAISCPQCGFTRRGGLAFEYRSETKLFGLPLVHIALGRGSGQIRVAKGIIAIGDIALGFISLGGVSFGLISLGGAAVGLAAAGGCVIGAGVAVGGAAVGYLAVGGAALGYYVLGGGCFGVEHLGGGNQILGSLNRRMFPIVSCLLRVFGH